MPDSNDIRNTLQSLRHPFAPSGEYPKPKPDPTQQIRDPWKDDKKPGTGTDIWLMNNPIPSSASDVVDPWPAPKGDPLAPDPGMPKPSSENDPGDNEPSAEATGVPAWSDGPTNNPWTTTPDPWQNPWVPQGPNEGDPWGDPGTYGVDVSGAYPDPNVNFGRGNPQPGPDASGDQGTAGGDGSGSGGGGYVPDNVGAGYTFEKNPGDPSGGDGYSNDMNKGAGSAGQVKPPSSFGGSPGRQFLRPMAAAWAACRTTVARL